MSERRHRRWSRPPGSIRAKVDIALTAADGGSSQPARLFTFNDLADPAEHVAVGLGPYAAPRFGAPLVRVHSECLTGDVLGSQRCDCGYQLCESITRITAAGGYLLYLRQEGRGIGLYSKVDAYVLQDLGMDTFQANRALGYHDDERDYQAAAQMLAALGVQRVDLLTNNPDKTRQLIENGIDVREEIQTAVYATADNTRYLRTKRSAGHRLSIDSRAAT